MIKLSIIIPFYNADEFIGRMLDSLLCQDLRSDEYEIIVIDDESPVEPTNLLRYSQKYSNIKYFRQDNAGPGGARNAGIQYARGEYIMFCDSDDFVAENVLGRLWSLANEHNLDMLFYNVPRVGINEFVHTSDSDFSNVEFFSTGMEYFALPVKNTITTGVWQFIIKRSFMDSQKLVFPSDMIMNEDSCFLYT